MKRPDQHLGATATVLIPTLVQLATARLNLEPDTGFTVADTLFGPEAEAKTSKVTLTFAETFIDELKAMAEALETTPEEILSNFLLQHIAQVFQAFEEPENGDPTLN